MGTTPFVVILIVVVVGAVGWKILRGGLGDAKFIVTVTGGGSDGVTVKGDAPGYSHGEIAEFVGGLELPAGAKFWAVPDGDRIRLSFSDKVPEHLHQRLRNFFYLRL